jgi:hypothetical protein
MRNSQKHSSQYSIIEMRKALKNLYSVLGSWRAVSKILGLPAGTLCAIAKGREPKKAEHRLALGLPVLAPASICPACKVVHVGRCKAQAKRRRNRLIDFTPDELRDMLQRREVV